MSTLEKKDVLLIGLSILFATTIAAFYDAFKVVFEVNHFGKIDTIFLAAVATTLVSLGYLWLYLKVIKRISRPKKL